MDSPRPASSCWTGSKPSGFCLERGVALLLRGPNGCGKSTLLRALLGLTPVTSGRHQVDGHAFGAASRPAAAGSVHSPAGSTRSAARPALKGRARRLATRRLENLEALDCRARRQADRDACRRARNSASRCALARTGLLPRGQDPGSAVVPRALAAGRSRRPRSIRLAPGSTLAEPPGRRLRCDHRRPVGRCRDSAARANCSTA